MYKPTNDEIREILGKHYLWEQNKEGGIRADFSDTDLSDVDFNKIKLIESISIGRNFSRVNHLKVSFWEAIFRNTDLSGANLYRADLRDVDFLESNLTNANLEGANMRNACLQKTNLTNANLTGAHLDGAKLQGSNLENANLEWADFRNANLEGAKLKGVDLRWAGLNFTVGNGHEILTIMTDECHVNIADGQICINDHSHTWEKWLSFSKEYMKYINFNNNVDTLEWWHEWKPKLATIIEERAAQRASTHDDTLKDAVTALI